MNSKQRIAAAMDHKKPDRVPVMCQLALGHYFLNCDYSPSEIWFDSETFANALVELQQRYKFDGILVNIPGRPPDWKSKLKSYKRIGNTEHLCWKSGLETVFPPDDNPQTYRRSTGRLTSKIQLRTGCPDMSGTPGTPLNSGILLHKLIFLIKQFILHGSQYLWKKSNSLCLMFRYMWKYSHLSRTLWNCSVMNRLFLL